jgi:hypothetical protein
MWFLDYLRVGRRHLKAAFTLVTSSLYTATSERERQKIHESVATETDRLVDTCLLAGTIAFAAWTALFAVANQAPGSEISSTTRSLLLVGAAALVAAPIVFRVPDRYTAYIGRRSALFIGLTAVGLALASLAEDLLGKVPGIVVTLAAVAVLVLCDVFDTKGEISLQRSTVRRALETVTQVDTAIGEAQDAATQAARAEQDAQATAERVRAEAKTQAAEQRAAAPEARVDTAGRDAQAADEAAKGDAE